MNWWIPIKKQNLWLLGALKSQITREAFVLLRNCSPRYSSLTQQSKPSRNISRQKPTISLLAG
jgi:hypothetical protein